VRGAAVKTKNWKLGRKDYEKLEGMTEKTDDELRFMALVLIGLAGLVLLLGGVVVLIMFAAKSWFL
jgi:hypothetical protein